MRIAWPMVGSIIARVRADIDARWTAWRGCAESGSMRSAKKKRKYLTVVVDHDIGQLVWARRATINRRWLRFRATRAAVVRANHEFLGGRGRVDRPHCRAVLLGSRRQPGGSHRIGVAAPHRLALRGHHGLGGVTRPDS
jgi:hypothetical protein